MTKNYNKTSIPKIQDILCNNKNWTKIKGKKKHSYISPCGKYTLQTDCQSGYKVWHLSSIKDSGFDLFETEYNSHIPYKLIEIYEKITKENELSNKIKNILGEYAQEKISNLEDRITYLEDQVSSLEKAVY